MNRPPADQMAPRADDGHDGQGASAEEAVVARLVAILRRSGRFHVLHVVGRDLPAALRPPEALPALWPSELPAASPSPDREGTS